MKRWLRDPLVHFVLVGAALFGLYRVFGKAPSRSLDNVILVSDEVVAKLATDWQATHDHRPSRLELQQLVEQFVRTEILYHEALALGLDRDDPVIRERLVQLLETRHGEAAGNGSSTGEPADELYRALRQQYEVILPARLAADARDLP